MRRTYQKMRRAEQPGKPGVISEKIGAYLSNIARIVERRGNTPDSFTSSFT